MPEIPPNDSVLIYFVKICHKFLLLEIKEKNPQSHPAWSWASSCNLKKRTKKQKPACTCCSHPTFP